MCAGEVLPRPQLGQNSLQVLQRATHPLQVRVLKLLPAERVAHLVITKNGPVITFGWLVQLDLVILDHRGLQLFRHALLHIARCLPDLEKPLVRLVVNRIRVDSRPSHWLRRQDFRDGGLTHRHRCLNLHRGSLGAQVSQ